MAAVTRIKVGDGIEIAPSATIEHWWNNATPRDAVWAVQAVPRATGSTSKGFAQTTRVEVTRVWRDFKVVEHSHSQFSDTTSEDENHYTLKNLTGAPAVVDVYMAIIN
jgi:hypothetical protein